MKDDANRQAGLSSIACSERKRKPQHEQLEMPFPKQVCRNRYLISDKLATTESETESTNSNSYAQSFMSCDEDDKTDSGFQKTCTSDEASTSSANWFGTSSDSSLYSSENRSSIYSSTSEQESLSITERQDCPVEIDHCCPEKELENLLYSNGAAHGSSYVLSSGRWSVHQGVEAKQESKKKKLPIDKEFEQYFSMLML